MIRFLIWLSRPAVLLPRSAIALEMGCEITRLCRIVSGGLVRKIGQILSIHNVMRVMVLQCRKLCNSPVHLCINWSPSGRTSSSVPHYNNRNHRLVMQKHTTISSLQFWWSWKATKRGMASSIDKSNCRDEGRKLNQTQRREKISNCIAFVRGGAFGAPQSRSVE